MTVTRDPAGGVTPEVDDELDALEAAATRARDDARRTAAALRVARRARGVEPSPSPAADLVEADAEADLEADLEADVVDEDLDETAQIADGGAEPLDLDDADEDDDDEHDDEDDDEDDDPVDADRPRRRPRTVTVVTTVVAVLAAVFVAVAAVVHVRANDAAASSPAAARDAALLAARQDIVVLNTLDSSAVDAGLQRWLAATTGALHDQLSQVSDTDKQAIAVSKSTTTASVLAAAVTQVDAAKGSATVLASVQVDVVPQSGTTTTKRTRFSLTMAREGGVWKIAAVQQVGVTLS